MIANIKRKIRNLMEKSDSGYRFFLRREGAAGPHGYPSAPWMNSVLKTHDEAFNAVKQINALGLHAMRDTPKNWDSLIALDFLLRKTNKKANIFDAGGALYSRILPWLFLYGYKNLTAGNLVFNKTVSKGPIIYQYNDITQTGFKDETFDAITCLSVIEHGVNLQSYFKEMSRILKPGGILITSTDYFDSPIDTKNQMAYGAPIHIFTKDEIIEGFKVAKQFGLELDEPNFDLSSNEKVVNWKRFDLQYTCIIFAMHKTD